MSKFCFELVLFLKHTCNQFRKILLKRRKFEKGKKVEMLINIQMYMQSNENLSKQNKQACRQSKECFPRLATSMRMNCF